MNLIEWLRYDDGRWMKKLAELMTVNGGMLIKTFGNVQPSEANRYKRTGLSPGEAVELAYLHGMFDAFKVNATAEQVVEAMQTLMSEAEGRQRVAILIPNEALAKELTKPWRKNVG